MSFLPTRLRAHAPTARLTTILGAASLVTGALVILPVMSSASPPAPVAPTVQNIALGDPEAPADGIEVVDPAATSAPAPTSESPAPSTATSEPTSEPAPPSADSSEGPTPSQEAPQTTGSQPPPTSSDPSASADPTNTAPPATDETQASAPMPVPPGSQTLILDKTQTKDFSSVGVSWIGDAPLNGLALQIRVQDSDTGQWSDWTELSVNREVAPNPDAPTQRQGSDPYWFGSSSGVEVAITVMTQTSISDLKLTLIDPKQVAADANPSAAPTSSAGAATPMPSVYTRAQWGADESLSGWSPKYMPTIKAATLHHSADGNNYSQADVPGLMRSIYYYQSKTLGWGDIGYNVVVDKFGRAWEGRKGGLDQPVVAAHAGGFNQYTFGVSMLGNYDLVDVPAETKEKVAQLIAWKFKLFGVDPNATTKLTQVSGAGTTAKFKDGATVTLPTIFGHRQTGSTACPGQYGYAILPWLRTRVAQIMSTLEAPPYYSPEGALSVKVDDAGTASVDGWMIDRSAIAAPVNGAVTVDGQVVRYLTADGPRPELKYYGIPGDHGFAFTTKLSQGVHTVCLYGSNVGNGSDSQVECKSVSFNAKAIAPIGALAASGNGNATISVNGWSYDGSSPMEPVITVITTDGKDPRYFYANGPRPELASYGMVGNHGFSFSYPVSTDGSHRVCMYAIDIGPGTMKEIECKTVSVQGNNPVGAMSASKSGGVVNVNGWAFDPSDLYAGTTIMVTRNGQAVAFAVANGPRPELAYYGVPGNHGFTTSFGAASGTNTVCLFVFNIGSGADSMVQCKNV